MRERTGMVRSRACYNICAESTLKGWEDGTNLPPYAAVKKLARRYGCRMGDLKRAR